MFSFVLLLLKKPPAATENDVNGKHEGNPVIMIIWGTAEFHVLDSYENGFQEVVTSTPGIIPDYKTCNYYACSEVNQIQGLAVPFLVLPPPRGSGNHAH
jgi:hypothetical protein